jgi:hypothetical protein
MTTTASQMRKERIERLLNELEYEIIRGVMEREIEPDLHFGKVFPVTGRGGGTACMELHVFALKAYQPPYQTGPARVRLRVVESESDPQPPAAN